MSEHLLEIKDVALNYHTLKDEIQAINNISFCVDKNEFISIVGPSGCGKTTLLSIISGLLKPSSGKIILNDEEVVKPSNHIGYMFQRDHLFEWRTVIQNIQLGLEINKQITDENKLYIDNLLKNMVYMSLRISTQNI